jgi:hypothetical protein
MSLRDINVRKAMMITHNEHSQLTILQFCEEKNQMYKFWVRRDNTTTSLQVLSSSWWGQYCRYGKRPLYTGYGG